MCELGLSKVLSWILMYLFVCVCVCVSDYEEVLSKLLSLICGVGRSNHSYLFIKPNNVISYCKFQYNAVTKKSIPICKNQLLFVSFSETKTRELLDWLGRIWSWIILFVQVQKRFKGWETNYWGDTKFGGLASLKYKAWLYKNR